MPTIGEKIIRESIGSTGTNCGALQLGPDEKIYVCGVLQGNLAVINDPNILGVGCNFDVNGPYLAGRVTRNGLPTFHSSIFISPPSGCVRPREVRPGRR